MPFKETIRRSSCWAGGSVGLMPEEQGSHQHAQQGHRDVVVEDVGDGQRLHRRRRQRDHGDLLRRPPPLQLEEPQRGEVVQHPAARAAQRPSVDFPSRETSRQGQTDGELPDSPHGEGEAGGKHADAADPALLLVVWELGRSELPPHYVGDPCQREEEQQQGRAPRQSRVGPQEANGARGADGGGAHRRRRSSSTGRWPPRASPARRSGRRASGPERSRAGHGAAPCQKRKEKEIQTVLRWAVSSGVQSGQASRRRGWEGERGGGESTRASPLGWRTWSAPRRPPGRGHKWQAAGSSRGEPGRRTGGPPERSWGGQRWVISVRAQGSANKMHGGFQGAGEEGGHLKIGQEAMNRIPDRTWTAFLLTFCPK